MKDPRDIIVKPILTEDTTEMMEDRKYVFEVAVKANKVEVRKAIEQIFGVKVEQVNTLRIPGKAKRQGKHMGRTKDRKKAIVKLTKDSKTIDIIGA